VRGLDLGAHRRLEVHEQVAGDEVCLGAAYEKAPQFAMALPHSPFR
jgi:hypothetical protein